MSDNIKIFMNNNVDMSKGKYAAQAVHAALNAAGIKHGSVVVLGGPKRLVQDLNTTIHDAGLTELNPGTLTAGTDWNPGVAQEGAYLTEEQVMAVKEAISIMERVATTSAAMLGEDHAHTEQSFQTLETLKTIV